MGYIPSKGYFDLTERPKSMSVITHKKIQDMQMVFVNEAEKYKNPEVRLNNRVNFEKLKEYIARLQSIILSNWPHEMLFK
jgi:hypothetical protein